MHIGYFGAAFSWIVIALCFASNLNINPTKPFVPAYCHRLCLETAGCCSYIYMARDLTCHLISSKEKTTEKSYSKRKHLFKDAKDIARKYAEKGMTCPNDIYNVKNGSCLEEKQRFLTLRGPRDNCRKQCRFDQIEASPCILHIQKQLNLTSNKKLIKLPLKVKSGMKLTVYGSCVKGLPYSQLTVTMDPKRPSDMFKWIHIAPEWKSKHISLTDRLLKKKRVEIPFPIKDPSHFALAIELTSSSTKIYANNIFLGSKKLIPYIKEFYLKRYKHDPRQLEKLASLILALLIQRWYI